MGTRPWCLADLLAVLKHRRVLFLRGAYAVAAFVLPRFAAAPGPRYVAVAPAVGRR